MGGLGLDIRDDFMTVCFRFDLEFDFILFSPRDIPSTYEFYSQRELRRSKRESGLSISSQSDLAVPPRDRRLPYLLDNHDLKPPTSAVQASGRFTHQDWPAIFTSFLHLLSEDRVSSRLNYCKSPQGPERIRPAFIS